MPFFFISTIFSKDDFVVDLFNIKIINPFIRILQRTKITKHHNSLGNGSSIGQFQSKKYFLKEGDHNCSRHKILLGFYQHSVFHTEIAKCANNVYFAISARNKLLVSY